MPVCSNCGSVLERDATFCSCGSRVLICCRTCGYWLPREGDVGFCRKGAPTYGPGGVAVWPRSFEWDWCGQFGALAIEPLAGASPTDTASYVGDMPGRAPGT